MFGARKSASSREHAIHPARNRRNVSLSPANAASPSRHRLQCTWQELPTQACSGFAMNVIEHPC